MRRKKQNGTTLGFDGNEGPKKPTTTMKIVMDNEEDDEEPPPVPTNTYSFSYDDNISIELQGFPADSEVIWTSTGLTLWRSSQYLCDYLMNNRQLLLQQHSEGKQPRVLEVGSGLGRCGILAHLLAPKTKIFLTDGDTDTLSQLRANIQRNITIKDDDKMNHEHNNISCHQLLWGKETADAFSKAHGGNFDVIMGSDLVYVPKVIQPLFETVQTLLSKPNGIFVMAHCARRHGNEVKLEMIVDAADQAGFTCNVIVEDNDILDDIYLYKFEWKTE